MSESARQDPSGLYLGDSLTREQQIANLRVLGEGGLIRGTIIGSALLAVAGFSFFAYADGDTGRVAGLFAGLCGVLLCLVAALGRPELRRAAAATRRGRREPASIELFPDPEDADAGTRRGELRPLSRHAPRWQMTFARTDGWTPPEGELPVEAVYLSDVAWPVLLLHRDGLLVPRSRPVRAG